MKAGRPGAAVVCSALALAACGDDSVTMAADGGERLTLTGAGRELAQDKAEVALVDESSLPQGANYVAQPVEKSTEGPRASASTPRVPKDPPACDAWWREWETVTDLRSVVANRIFHKDGKALNGWVQYSVRSFPDPADATRYVDQLAKLPTDCKEFVTHMTSIRGPYDIHYQVSAMDFSRPGDRSAAVKLRREYRLRGERHSLVRYQQLATVQVGHNVIFLDSTTPDPIPDGQVSTLLNDGFRRLEEATR